MNGAKRKKKVDNKKDLWNGNRILPAPMLQIVIRGVEQQVFEFSFLYADNYFAYISNGGKTS